MCLGEEYLWKNRDRTLEVHHQVDWNIRIKGWWFEGPINNFLIW